MSVESHRRRRRRIAPLVALAALLAGALPGTLHRDALHASRMAGVESVVEGCGQQHPPRFEPRLGSHRVDCPACLLQLQRACAPTARIAGLGPTAPGQRLAVFASLALAGERFLLASPRGPPARLARAA
jgi:hypothetical protein